MGSEKRSEAQGLVVMIVMKNQGDAGQTLYPDMKWNMRSWDGTSDVKVVIEEHGAAKNQSFKSSLDAVLKLFVLSVVVVT